MIEIKNLVAMCDQVLADMENDAKTIDGQPFNGSTIGASLGNLMAGVAALSSGLKELALKVEANEKFKNPSMS